jgi:Ala-tRNA(Pro) deacylase
VRVNVVIDAGLMRHETINCHPLVNTMTTSIGRDDLVKFLEATGHVPRIERVADTASEAPAAGLQSDAP